MSVRVVSIVAPILLCVGPVLAFGQGYGEGQNGQGPGQGLGNQQTLVSQPTSQAATAAPAAAIVSVFNMTGTLDDVVGGFALGHPYFVFTSGGTTYEIKAAPYKFLTNLNVTALIGQTVQMIFAQCRQGSYVALQITDLAGVVYVFRDENGKPAWRQWPVDSSSGTEATLTVDPASIETVTAVVDSVGTSAASNMVRARIRLRDQQQVWVTLGPDSLLLDQGFELQVGDRITMMLAVRATNRERVALQVENPDTGQMALIRSREGHQYRLKY